MSLSAAIRAAGLKLQTRELFLNSALLNYAIVESNLQQLIKLVLDPISWSSSIHLKWFKFQSSLHSLRTTSRDQKIEKHH